MRHIVYILIIILLVSVIIGFKLLATSPPAKTPALAVNDKVFSSGELNELSRFKRTHQTKNNFLNAIITEELLIQEARNLGIHQQENFRKSVENFYKQSLIKILIDMKLDAVKTFVTDEEADRYLELQNSIVFLTEYDANTLDETKQLPSEYRHKNKFYFKDLSNTVAYLLSSIKEGETTKPIRNDEGFVVYRLDRIEKSPSKSDISKELVIKILLEEKKKQVIDEWIETLRAKSSIRYEE